ncbi:uncharacterized protein MYCFIDRAFT_180589 [Pseudocercospora fijiensis CIRAD86]|uniref:Uncharacterized protein n=1 Tax=Pseudocercospora fijiensis (strain CIRAD86) TaxID=383855 RepID=M2ZXT8_PSEFD|nr:uncharacterized protein MYCFIDRAFT_180589 [Pseudocercospora fijiensis CIRAD86]EME76931.1 hypothetical protein MYCFIDRAFT_180589 [Pseudocercospora fijiensis CIRAD86]
MRGPSHHSKASCDIKTDHKVGNDHLGCLKDLRDVLALNRTVPKGAQAVSLLLLPRAEKVMLAVMGPCERVWKCGTDPGPVRCMGLRFSRSLLSPYFSPRRTLKFLLQLQLTLYRRDLTPSLLGMAALTGCIKTTILLIVKHLDCTISRLEVHTMAGTTRHESETGNTMPTPAEVADGGWYRSHPCADHAASRNMIRPLATAASQSTRLSQRHAEAFSCCAKSVLELSFLFWKLSIVLERWKWTLSSLHRLHNLHAVRYICLSFATADMSGSFLACQIDVLDLTKSSIFTVSIMAEQQKQQELSPLHRTHRTSSVFSPLASHATTLQDDPLDTAYRSPSLANSQTAFLGNDRGAESDHEAPKNRKFHTEEPEQATFSRVLILQIFALSWTVPIVALLVLNIKRHVIGATAWCPLGRCLPRVEDPDPTISRELPAVFDRQTHNLLGFLQLIAKALEVRFILIATWLVYLMTIRLAPKLRGLPIGYLSRPSEFAEIPSLFDAQVWSTLHERGVNGQSRTSKRARYRLWTFILITVILCVLCNLMVRVVLLRTYADANKLLHMVLLVPIVHSRFDTLNANGLPGEDGYQFAVLDAACAEGWFDIQYYNCSDRWQRGIDAWVASTFARQDYAAPVTSFQGMVAFTYNATELPTSNATFENGTLVNEGYLESINWAPSRQMLNELTDDLLIVQSMSRGWDALDPRDKSSVSTYAPYNNTVQTVIRRKGPILGALINTWVGYNTTYDSARHYTITVGWNRMVRCYENYDLYNSPLCFGTCESSRLKTYTRCITLGTGWNDGYKSAKFRVASKKHMLVGFNGPSAHFEVHASGRAAYVPSFEGNETLPEKVIEAGFPMTCLSNKTVNDTRCIWDAFFNLTAEDPEVKPHSRNVTSWQIWWDMKDYPNKPNNIVLAVDFETYVLFGDYELDPSRLSNPHRQVNHFLPSVRKKDEILPLNPIRVDPAWTRAAWAVEQDGTIDSTRAAANRLQELSDQIYATDIFDQNQTDVLLHNRYYLNSLAVMPIMQTLSLIEYNVSDAEATDDDNDPEKPLLVQDARINVWAYGLASRTSWLGLVVVVCGCFVVVAEFVLGMNDRRLFRSPTQLLVAALEYHDAGEFNSLYAEKDDDSDFARRDIREPSRQLVALQHSL